MEDPSEAELRAVFGPRADYYLAQWQGTGRRISNWAAFWLSGLWLPFRRLYLVALLFYTAIAVETVLEEVAFSRMGHQEVPAGVNRVVTLACALVCGVWGNHWYFTRVRRVISDTRALGLSPDEHLRELGRRGGTRIWHAVGFFLVFMVMLMSALITLTAIAG